MSIANKTILVQANAVSYYEGFPKHCTDDTQWTFVGKQTLRGKLAVRQWQATTYHKLPRFQVEHLVTEADFITAVGTILLLDAQGQPVEPV